MQIVILAGGLGTRLRPLTETIPKPLVDVHGKPFLEYQLEMVKSHGFTKILILTGYLGHMIQDYFGDGKKRGVDIDYSFEQEKLLGTGGAVKLAESKLEDEFIVINGDSYLDFDYHHLLDVMHGNPALKACFTAFDNSQTHSNVKNNLIVEGGMVKKYEKGTENPELNYVDAGVIAMKKNLLAQLPQGREGSLEADILLPAIQQGVVGAYVNNVLFYDIGTFDRLDIFKTFQQ